MQAVWTVITVSRQGKGRTFNWHAPDELHCGAMRLQQRLFMAFAATGHPALRLIRRRAFATLPLVGTGPLTPLKALMALNQCRHPLQCFSDARRRRLNLMEVKLCDK
jgi:hypothetical protein